MWLCVGMGGITHQRALFPRGPGSKVGGVGEVGVGGKSPQGGGKFHPDSWEEHTIAPPPVQRPVAFQKAMARSYWPVDKLNGTRLQKRRRDFGFGTLCKHG